MARIIYSRTSASTSPSDKGSIPPQKDVNYRKYKSRGLTNRDLNRVSLQNSQIDESRNLYPIPKGDSPYAKAKKAEYIEKDLLKAERLLRYSIKVQDRTESALKDLAGLLHRQGRTSEACELLKKHRLQFKDQAKFNNLLNNLERQVVPSGNCLNKCLKISGLRATDNAEVVYAIFRDSSRILEVQLKNEETLYGKSHFAVVTFGSHSAARKTLEGFNLWSRYKLEWLSVGGEVAGEVYHNKPEGKRERKTFIHRLFWRDPEDRVLALPVDKVWGSNQPCDAFDQADISHFLGRQLLSDLTQDYQWV